MHRLSSFVLCTTFGAAVAGKCCWSRWGDQTTCGGYPADGHGGLCNVDYKTPCKGSSPCTAPTPGPAPGPSPPGPSPPGPAPGPSPPAPSPMQPGQVHKNEVYNVKTTKDVTYAQGLHACSNQYMASTCKPMDLKLDIYEPAAKSGGGVPVPTLKPAYVMMHGGGNVGGTKGGLNIYVARWWASRGFVVFDINYRLAGDKGLLPAKKSGQQLEWAPAWASAYPATRDAKAAIRFVRANADKYGIDPQRIASTGGSAGATDMFAGGVSFEDDYKSEIAEADDPTLVSTHVSSSSAVQCLVLHWPSEGGVSLVQDHYPTLGQRYRSVNPPVVSFHGDQDTTIPIQHSYAIQKAYAETGAPFSLHVLAGCPHGSWCYDGKGHCTCSGSPRSPLMEELAFPNVTHALNLTVVDGSAAFDSLPTMHVDSMHSFLEDAAKETEEIAEIAVAVEDMEHMADSIAV